MHFLLSAALCLASCGAAMASDVANGTGWSLSDQGVLTVGADYEWVNSNLKCQEAWSGNISDVRSVVLADGVESIGAGAFAQCENLVSVEMPATVTAIGNRAFSGCSSLRSIDLPDGITVIKDYTFSYCSSLRSVSLPKELTKIGQYAFNRCYGLAGIEIPAGVSLIDMGAFSECNSLSKVIMRPATPPSAGSFGENVTLIVPAEAVEAYKAEEWAQECEVTYAKAEGYGWVLTAEGDLTVDETYEWKGTAAGECAEEWKDYADDVFSVDIFAGVTNVAPGSFSGFAALESVGLAASVTDVGAGAFDGCDALVSVLSLAATPPSLGDGAFAGKIDDLTVAWASEDAYKASDWGEYFTTVSSAVDGGEGWSLSIDGVLEVGPGYAWSDVSNPWEENGEGVKDIVLSEGVKEVGEYAFSSCFNVLSVSLPASLEKIGESAFNDCYSLSGVTCLAVTPPALDDNTFWEMDSPLYVTAEAVEAYKASDWAHYFGEIRAIETPPVTAVADVAETDGAPARVFSLQGRMMPAGRPLGRGVYVVATPRGAVRVAVR